MAEEPEISSNDRMEDLPADLSLTRAKFFNEIFPEIFGEKKVAEVTQEDINSIIVDYEEFLGSRGLLNTGPEPKREV